MISKQQTPIYPPCDIVRKPPINMGNDGGQEFLKNVSYQSKPVALFRYAGVNVTPEGIVFRNFQIDRDLLIYPKHIRIYNFIYLASSLIKRKKITLPPAEKYLLCIDYWSNSIFHWMCDTLPRLEAVKDLAKECIFLLPKFYQYPYILETLKAFPVKGIYLMEDSTYLRCAQLYAPEQITVSGHIRPDNILSLRQTLLTYFKPKFGGNMNHPNVYVSRSKAKYRKVLNENVLLPIIEKYGFKIVYFEDYTVTEQIELCYTADNLVSIHGANLTNVIFMQPGKNVMELRKRGDVLNNYYYELADSIGCNYFHLDCEFEDPEPEKNIFSLYADPKEFESCLKKLLMTT